MAVDFRSVSLFEERFKHKKKRQKAKVHTPGCSKLDGDGMWHDEASKGFRWMPWHLLAMKDVEGCEKRRVAAKRAMIR